MNEQEAKNGEERERSLMSRADWGFSKQQPWEWRMEDMRKQQEQQAEEDCKRWDDVGFFH